MTGPPLRVFVSSRMQELSAEREVVHRALAQLHVEGWIFEKHAGARPGSIQETYLAEVESADLYLGIFWKGYGAYTIEEFEHAELLGMDCLIYEKSATPDETRDPELAAFLRRIGDVTEGVTVKPFQTAHQLGESVAKDVADWQARIVRGHADRPPAIQAGVPSLPIQVVGRNEIIGRLVTRLRAGEDLAIDGLAGVGKTTLAVALTRHPGIRRHFRDGILWASLGPRGVVADALARWAAALKLDSTDRATDADRAQAIRDALGARRVLLVIDDVWDFAAAKELRCGGVNCAHLLTTRDQAIARAFAGAAQASSLPTLNEAQAAELLRALAPAAWAADPDAAGKLLATAGGLPMGIRLIGGYLEAPERAMFPDLFPELSDEAFAELMDPRNRLQLAESRLGSRGGEPSTWQDTVLLSLHGLPEEARRAFFALGAFEPMPARFSRSAAEAVTGATARTLALLAARHVIQIEQADQQLTLHRSVSDVARSELDAPAAERHRAFYLSLVAEGRNRYDRWLVMDHYPQISLAWRNAPDDERLLDDLFVMRPFFDHRNAWREYIEWADRALLTATRLELHRYAALLADLGYAWFQLCEWGPATKLYDEALPLLEGVGDRCGHARALFNRGMCECAVNGRAGVDMMLRAITLLAESNDSHGQSEAYSILARVYAEELGEGLEALAFHYKAEMTRGDSVEHVCAPSVILLSTPKTMRSLQGRPRLLSAFRVLVDLGKEADFTGHVVIGVRRDNAPSCYWEAHCEKGQRLTTAFLDQPPLGADAVLIVDERDADWVLHSGPNEVGRHILKLLDPLGLPPRAGVRRDAAPIFQGDRDLIIRFVDTFVCRDVTKLAEPPEKKARNLYLVAIGLDRKGEKSRALELVAQAADIQARLLGEGDRRVEADLAESLHQLARFLWEAGRHEEAMHQIGEGLKILWRLVEEDKYAEQTSSLVRSLRWRGCALLSDGKQAAAESDFAAVIDLTSQTPSSDVAARRALAEDHGFRALAQKGRDDASVIADFDRAIALRRQLLAEGEDGAGVDLAADLLERGRAHMRCAVTDQALRDPEEADLALRDLEEAARIFRAAIDGRRDAGSLENLEKLADACFKAGVLAAMLGRTLQSRTLLDEAVTRCTTLVNQGRDDWLPWLAKSHHWAAMSEGVPLEDALGSLTQAIAIYSDCWQRKPDPDGAGGLMGCLIDRAKRLLWHGRVVEAGIDGEKAIELATPLFADAPDRFKDTLLQALNLVAWIRATAPDTAARNGALAVKCATWACEISDWANYQSFDTLAAAYAESGDYAHAIEWQSKAIESADPAEKVDFLARLELYRAGIPFRDRSP